MRNIYLTLLLTICILSLLPACTVHRLDVQQGNIIKDEMLEKLVVGISKRQVRFIAGTPLLQDPFHPDRWDYVFTKQPGDKRQITEYKHIAIFFEDDKLIKVVKK